MITTPFNESESRSASNMFEVWLTVADTELRSTEEIMLAAGALSITLQGADSPVFETAPGKQSVWPITRVTALYDGKFDIQQLQQQLEATLDHKVTLSYRVLVERDWASLWMEHFKPMRYGKSLWIYPSWHDVAVPSAVNILLDPGQAFGTGTHPTTALCLEWLDAHPPRGCLLIDYGCGSGILAVAALKLGARHVQAVDIDTQALRTTQENVKKNHINPETLDIVRPQDMGSLQADVLLANILLGPLIELKPTIGSHVKQGGTVVLSGILSDQEDTLINAYVNDFQFKQVYRKDSWVLLEGVKI